jgi:spoIIIJ-associated protein
MKSFLDFEEKNVEKAIQKACTDLNLSREKLKYDIISYGSSGIFGLVGAKKALIRVFVPEIQKTQSAAHRASGSGQPEEQQSDKEYSVNALVDEAFGEVPEPAQAKPKPKPKPKPKKKPPAEKQSAENHLQENHQPVNQSPKPEKQNSAMEKPENDSQVKETPVEENPPAAREQAIAEEISSSDEKVDNDAAIAVARDLAQEILKTMGVEAALSEKTESNQNWINVKVAEPGILIGKRGQTLDAIQYLADKIVNKQCGKGSRVIFDVEGYVESRKTELKDLAARLASKALKTGKPSTMTRMNAHDRRIVHMSLKKNRAVRTQSVGDGYYRKLIIFPKKKSTQKSEKTGPKE